MLHIKYVFKIPNDSKQANTSVLNVMLELIGELGSLLTIIKISSTNIPSGKITLSLILNISGPEEDGLELKGMKVSPPGVL